MQIIGGKVSFKRAYQPEQYGSKGAEVEISFSLGEGEELGTKLDEVGVLVKNKTLELCGIRTEKVGAAPPDVKLEPAPKAEVPAKTKADLEKEQTDKLNAKVKTEKKPAPKSEAAPAPAKEKAVEPEAEGEDLGGATFDEDAEENQPDVTGEVMSQAMNAAVARLNKVHGGAAPKLVKALIATFVEPPKKSHDIPQKMRHEFLKKLAELK